MVKLTALLLAVFAVAVWRANADSDTEIEMKIDAGMAAFVQTCLQEMGINVKEPVKLYPKSKILETLDPCVYECLFKKMGAINDKRFFDMTNFAKAVSKFLNGPGDAEKHEIIGKACASDKPFTKCEQSKDMLYCLIDNKVDL